MTTYSHTSTSNRSRSTVRLPVTSNEHIDLFKGADISSYSGLIYNGIIDTYSNEDRKYVTERPSIRITKDASRTVEKDKGRGIFYWNSTRYIVNDDGIYRGNYSSPLSFDGTALISGTGKVYFQNWSSANDSYLFIVNPEGNQIFVVMESNNVAINMADLATTTGTGAPFNALDTWDVEGLPVVNGKTLCDGAVSLDSYLFLGCKDGTIYSSNVGNWLHWNALDFITAERENDQLLYIDKTKDHIAAFGERSIELFYDAGNPVGSPLSVRPDVAFKTGIVSGETSWSNGDDICFLGIQPAGDFSVFTLKNFQLEQNSSSTLESYLRHSRTEIAIRPVASGLATGGHTYFIITLFNAENTPLKSLVYDAYSTAWYEWNTSLNDKFPVIGWTTRTPEKPVTAQGILSNGDVFRIDDNFYPIDSYGASDYYFTSDYLTDSGITDDYLEGYISDDLTANIPMKIIIDNFSGLSSELKFMHAVEYAGSAVQKSQNLIIEWSDDENTWYSDTIDIKERTQINRLGSFVRRRFRLNYSGDEQIRIEAIDVTYTQGG